MFARVCGRSVLEWTIRRLCSVAYSLIVVGRPNELAEIKRSIYKIGKVPADHIEVVAGGDTRQDLVRNGLAALDWAADTDLVMVHDAARPLVSDDVLSRVVSCASMSGAAVAALPISETVKHVTAETIDSTISRDSLWTVQTPQVFGLGLLRKAHERASFTGFVGTDEASLVEHEGSVPVWVVAGARENIKITTASDLAFAQSWLNQRGGGALEADPVFELATLPFRVGHGYDIHRFVDGRPLVLGGVAVDFHLGLDGHSDADVVLHAICNSLLGAAGLPDIGQQFPNTDDSYRNIASTMLLNEVARKLTDAGWVIGNIDAVVIAERPKIAQYVLAMCTAVATALDIEPAQVSIKATTNEGLGAIGEGRGIACHASSTLLRRRRNPAS